jgi:hypothetical protein
MVTATRSWDNHLIPPQVVLDADRRFLGATPSEELTDGGERMRLLIDQNEPRYIVSRIGSDVPVLDSAIASGFRLFSAADTGMRFIRQYPDGTQLLQTELVLSPVLPDLVVAVEIFVGGVTFDDGTIYKELTATDFDQLGRAKIRFIRPATARTATCHTIKVYQGGVLISEP